MIYPAIAISGLLTAALAATVFFVLVFADWIREAKR
jgi:uncharacterized membrane protein YbaN (DUF454 family)